MNNKNNADWKGKLEKDLAGKHLALGLDAGVIKLIAVAKH